MQIVSDVCGLNQEVHRESVGASYGDAWMAGVGIGAVKPEQSWNEVVGTVVANSKLQERYDDLYSMYRHLYPATSKIVHALADSPKA